MKKRHSQSQLFGPGEHFIEYDEYMFELFIRLFSYLINTGHRLYNWIYKNVYQLHTHTQNKYGVFLQLSNVPQRSILRALLFNTYMFQIVTIPQYKLQFQAVVFQRVQQGSSCILAAVNCPHWIHSFYLVIAVVTFVLVLSKLFFIQLRCYWKLFPECLAVLDASVLGLIQFYYNII